MSEHRNAYMSIDQDTFVRAVWDLEAPWFNLLGWMYKPKDKPWEIGYRFRYFEDGKAFNSEDRKNGYKIDLPSPEPTEQELTEVSNAIDEMLRRIVFIEQLLAPGEVRCQRIDVNCVGLEAHAVLATKLYSANVYGVGQTAARTPRGDA